MEERTSAAERGVYPRLRERLKMRTGSITRKVLMNWYALSFSAIFTLGLTGAIRLTAARKTSFQPVAGAPIQCPSGVSTPNIPAIDGFTSAGWTDNPKFYQGVVRQYCRMCYVAQPQSFTGSSDFEDYPRADVTEIGPKRHPRVTSSLFRSPILTTSCATHSQLR